ncbi:MAG: hypothetical protein ACR2RB_05995 [Gammaproteobacteria bacterium]
MPSPDKQPTDELGRLYARAAREPSPPAVDSRILIEARQTIAKPRAGSPFSGGWKVPLSMAAVLVIGLAVILDAQRQQETGVPVEKPTAPVQADPPASVKAGRSLDVKEDPFSAPAPETTKREMERAGQPVQAGQAEDAGLQRSTPPPSAPARPTQTKRSLEIRDETSTEFAPEPEERRAKSPAEQIQTEPVGEIRAQESAPGAGAASPEPDFAPAPPAWQHTAPHQRLEPADGAAPAPLAGEAADMEQLQEPGRSAPATVAPESSSAVTGNREFSRLPAGRWIEQIRKLIAQGELIAARTQLEAFMRAYPDYVLDAELRELLARISHHGAR